MSINLLSDPGYAHLYKLKYNIALYHLYSQAFEGIDKVINQDQNLQIKAAAYMIKESMLKKLGRFE